MRTSLPLFLLALLLVSVEAVSQSSASAAKIKAVEQAETKMFQNVKFSLAKEYFRTDVADDFFTINADGVWADKQQSLADTARLKMFEMADIKVLDRKIRVYGNVGITNGRGQAFINNSLVAEFLYTTVFVKRKGKWMYTGWQGTMSKDTPTAPPVPQQ